MKIKNLRELKSKRPQADTTPPSTGKAKKTNTTKVVKKVVETEIDDELEGVRAKLQAMPTPMPPGAWPKTPSELATQVTTSTKKKAPTSRKKIQTRSPIKATPRLSGTSPKTPIKDVRCPTPPPSAAMFTFNKTAPYTWSAESGFQYQHETEEPPSPTPAGERSKSPIKWLGPDPPPSPKKTFLSPSPEAHWFAPTQLDLRNPDPDASPRHKVKIPKPPRKVDVRAPRVIKLRDPVTPTPDAHRRVQVDKHARPVPFKLPKPVEPVTAERPGRLALRRDKEPPQNAYEEPTSPLNPRYQPYPIKRPPSFRLPALPQQERPKREVPKPIRKAAVVSSSPFNLDFIYGFFGPRRPPVPGFPEPNGLTLCKGEAGDPLIVQCFEKYADRWEKLKDPYAGWALKLPMIPWPLEKYNPPLPSMVMFTCPTSEELSSDAIGEFLLSRRHSPGVARKKRIQNALRLYHPDKFSIVLDRIIDQREKEIARRTAAIVVKVLNQLMEEQVF